MRHKTIDNVLRLNRIAADALAEVDQLQADGLSIHEATRIGNSNESVIKRVVRQAEWLDRLRMGVDVDVT